METAEEYPPSCPANQTTLIPPSSLSSSFACSSETPLSSPTHTGSKSSYQQPESQDRYREPSISPSNTPSSTTVCARNTTVPTTANRWHNIRTYLTKDFPRPPSSPLEQTMELSPQKHTQNQSHQDTRPYTRPTQMPHQRNQVLSTPPPVLPDFILEVNNVQRQKQNQKKKMKTAALPVNTLMQDYSTETSSLPSQKQKIQNRKTELKKEILKLVVKDFTAMDNKWKCNSGRFETQTLAIYFRKLNKDTALYLLRIHPQLYFTMTNLLKSRGLTLPNPSQAKWARISLTHHKELRAQLAKAHNHVETIPLGGASCYDPPQFFSSLSDPLLVTLPTPK